MRLRGILFDMDGTLGDTLPACLAAYRRAFEVHTSRIYSDAEIEAMFGPSEEGAIERHFDGPRDVAMRTYLEEYERVHVDCRTPFPGMLDALTRLRERGLRLAIVTGKGEHSLAISVRYLGLEGCFDTMEWGSPRGIVKPDCIRRVLSRWQMAPEEAAYVGDSPKDVDSAREAGVLALGAGWAPGADHAAIAARSPHALFRTVPEFMAWFEHEQAG